ncbi:MAG TPA: hypothetical protein VH374_16730 [Polyangia bacterium]|nr:hypothetical protein [Polyangia bacterium]
MNSIGRLLVASLIVGAGGLSACRQSNLVGGPLPPPDNAGGVVTSLPTIPNQALMYRAELTAQPKVIDTDQTTDAPLMGNGDLGVAIFGGIDAMTFNLNKNEFWSLGEGRVKAMERLTLAIPGMVGATYAMTEELGLGEITGTFSVGDRTITTKSWVQADDTTVNRVITQLTLTGGGSLAASVTLAIGHLNTYASTTSAMGDVLYRDVRADDSDTIGAQATRRVRVATRTVGATGTVANDAMTFTLTSNAPVWLITGVMSNLDDANYQSRVLDSVASLGANDVTALEAAHRSWWDRFYRQSFVEIPDKVLEKFFYAALYLFGSASRAGEQAPGLWANWVMRDPAWNGDYGLDYNYEAPYYAVFPTNHVELAANYDQPIIDWLPNAQAEATKNGWTGAYYRVHIGPLPNGSADTNEWNQKFNNAFAASVMISHYYSTRDPAYAAGIYDTLKQMSIFWQDYLKTDGARYVVYSDPQQEGGADPQVNGFMSLGFVRLLFQGTIDISTALGRDADQRAVWQDRMANLSAFPTFTRDGKTVFRYTEVGLDWYPSNAVGIHPIYPAGQIGLGSDPALLSTAQNMVDEMARWNDQNGTNTFYPAAARVGHDPIDILMHLDTWVGGNSYPNLHIHTSGGGIENLNTVPSTISEMLLQSFQGKLRLFADWPISSDARFGNLRAWGGFLVASRLTGGIVQYVRIASEQGQTAILVNPWPGQTLRLYRNGVDAGTLSGPEVTLPTAKGEVLTLARDGTTYAAIVPKL